MDTTDDVIYTLTEQAKNLRIEIDHLTESLNALESLKEEIIQVDSVNFKKYADILTQLQMKNERYWLLKYLDDDVFDFIKNHVFGEENAVKKIEVINTFIADAAKLHEEGVSPESERAQELAKRFWDWVMG